jgi:NAD(P)H-hydrate epimerase
MGLTASREKAAEQLAQRLGRIIVLKGHQTVVTDGQRTWVCPAHLGHPCLATAGTGDVLTGLIASLAAQFVAPPMHPAVAKLMPQMGKGSGKPLDLFGAAVAGVAIHALAGSVWARLSGCEGGMLSTDLVELLPMCVQHLREPRA